jgi:uncharacterized protein YndB with AHSA1/START domain
VKLVDNDLYIEAPPARVYELLTDTEQFVRWMAGTGTRPRLVHRGLDDSMADAHDGGRRNYLHRLATVARGDDPGADPGTGR